MCRGRMEKRGVKHFQAEHWQEPECHPLSKAGETSPSPPPPQLSEWQECPGSLATSKWERSLYVWCILFCSSLNLKIYPLGSFPSDGLIDKLNGQGDKSISKTLNSVKGGSESNWMRISAATERGNGKKRATFREEMVMSWKNPNRVREPFEPHSDISRVPAKVSESANFRKKVKGFLLSVKISAIKDSKLKSWGDSSEDKIYIKHAWGLEFDSKTHVKKSQAR